MRLNLLYNTWLGCNLMLLRLIEYGNPYIWTFDDESLDTLRDESEYWKQQLGLPYQPFEINYAGHGQHTIRAQGVSGFIKVGELLIEIKPKFLSSPSTPTWRQALWQILTSIEEYPSAGSMFPARVNEEESFADLIGARLIESVRRGHIEGLPRGYLEASESVDLV